MAYTRVGQTLTWVDAGKIQLRNATTGAIHQYSTPEAATSALASGQFEAASAEDVEDYDRRKGMGVGAQVAEQAQTFGESAAAGLIDLNTTVVRAELLGAEAALGAVGAEGLSQQAASLRQGLGGRQVLGAVAGGAEVLGGGEFEQGREEYLQASRERAEAAPTTAGAGYFVGQLPAVFVPEVRALGALGRVATGAAEGFLQGTSAAGENAFLRGDNEVSAEEVLADGLFGGLLGGGIAGGGAAVSGALGAGRRAAGRGLESVFGRADEAASAADAVASRADDGAYRKAAQASDADLARMASEATGETVDPKVARSFYDTYVAGPVAQASELASGGDAAFIKRALSATDEGAVIREVARNPDAVLDVARGTMTESLTKYRKAMDAITEVSRDMEVKESAWRKLIPSELSNSSRARAVTRSREVREAFAGIASAAEELELRGANKGVWDRVTKQLNRNLDGVANARDGAEAFTILDRTKRMLQKNIKDLRERATRVNQHGGDQYPLRALAQRMEDVQEPVRQFLEDTATWGERAGKAQQQINVAWAKKLDPNAEANYGFRGVFERLGTEYQEGAAVYRVSENGVEAFVNRVGRKAGGQEYADMTRQLAVDRDLVNAIGDSVGRSSPEFKAFAEGASELEKTLEQVKVRGGYANQFKLLQQAGGAGVGNLGVAGLAFALGGPVAGGAVALLSNPAAMIRNAAAVAAAAGRIDARINGHLGRTFRKLGAAVPRLPENVEGAAQGLSRGIKATSTAARRAAVPAAERIFVGRHKGREHAYERRTQEIRELTTNPALRQERLQQSIAGAPNSAMAAHLATKQARALAFLRSKLPVIPQRTITPQASRLGPPPGEIDRFARYWSTIADPMSVLEDLERGRCTPEQVEALQAVYPQLYQRVRERSLSWLAASKEPPPYELRANLDLLLQLNGQAEPSLSPAFANRQASRLAALRAKQPPAGRPTGGAPRLSDNYESGLSLKNLEAPS